MNLFSILFTLVAFRFTIHLFSVVFVPSLSIPYYFITILLLIILIPKMLYNKKTAYIVIIILISSFFGMLFSRDIIFGIEQALKFLFFGLLFLFFSKNIHLMKFQEFLLKYKNLFISLLVISTFIVLIDFFSGNNRLLEWGTSIYIGFFPNPHTTSYFTCLLIIQWLYCFFVFKDKKTKSFSVLVIILLLVVSLYTGSRTVIGINLLIIMYIFFLKNNKNIFYIFIIAMGSIPVMINTSFFQKTLNTIEGGSLSNGRDFISETYLNYYSDQPVLNKFVGTGFDGYIKANNLGLGAHNDFIQLINSVGVLGLSIYIYILFVFFNKTIFLGILFLLGATFNGAYGYTDFIVMFIFAKLIILLIKEQKE